MTGLHVPSLIWIDAKGNWPSRQYHPVKAALAEVLDELPNLVLERLREKGIDATSVSLRYEECQFGREHTIPPTLVYEHDSATGRSEPRLVK